NTPLCPALLLSSKLNRARKPITASERPSRTARVSKHQLTTRRNSHSYGKSQENSGQPPERPEKHRPSHGSRPRKSFAQCEKARPHRSTRSPRRRRPGDVRWVAQPTHGRREARLSG